MGDFLNENKGERKELLMFFILKHSNITAKEETRSQQ